MSYETQRFGWQKLLITQVPQKGGGGGVYVDYQGQWTAAQNAFNKSEQVINEVAATYGRIAASPAEAPGIVTTNNAKINATINELNGVINQVSGIPDYIFSGSSISKSEAINILSSSRNNLTSTLSDVPKPPAPPAPPVPPPTPIIRKPEVEVVPSPPQRSGGLYVPTGKVDGTGTFLADQPIKPAPQVIVYAQNGATYGSPALVPFGLKWSYKPWRWEPDNVEIPPRPRKPVPPPKTELQILQEEVNKQTQQLQKINRILNKPIDPAIPEEIYPSTSWQYELWNKGYSLHEISYAEDQAAKNRLLDTSNGNFALFKAKVENLLQDAILGNIIPKPISQEIVPLTQVGIISTLVSVDVSSGNEPPPPTISVVNGLPGGVNVQMPYQPNNPIINQPIRCPVPLPVVDLPETYFDERGRAIPPRFLPIPIRRRRVFQPRAVQFDPPRLNDLPGVRTCSTSTMPRKDNWEDCLVGAGASVAELDTVRRTMAQSKLDPNADVCEVAKNMLASVRNPRATGLGNIGSASPAGSIFGQNPVNNIPGVFRCGVSTVRMVQSNTIARVREQQARRGAIINRNRK